MPRAGRHKYRIVAFLARGREQNCTPPRRNIRAPLAQRCGDQIPRARILSRSGTLLDRPSSTQSNRDLGLKFMSRSSFNLDATRDFILVLVGALSLAFKPSEPAMSRIAIGFTVAAVPVKTPHPVRGCL